MDSSTKVADFFGTYPQVKLKRNEVILSAGDEITSIYYIKEGLVRQTVISPFGEVFTIHLYRAGAFFPLVYTMGKFSNNYYFDTFTPAVLYRAPVEDVIKFVRTEPDVLLNLVSRLSSGLGGIVHRLEILALSSAYYRTCALLSYLGKNYGQNTNGSTVLPFVLTHKEIASWIGTSRETASIQIERLAREGSISYNNRRISIKNLEEFFNPGAGSKGV